MSKLAKKPWNEQRLTRAYVRFSLACKPARIRNASLRRIRAAYKEADKVGTAYHRLSDLRSRIARIAWADSMREYDRHDVGG